METNNGSQPPLFIFQHGQSCSWCINPHLLFEIVSPRSNKPNALLLPGEMNWIIFSRSAIQFYNKYIVNDESTKLAEVDINWLKDRHIIQTVQPFNNFEFTAHPLILIKSREKKCGTTLFQYRAVGVIWRDLAFAIDAFFKRKINPTGSQFRLLTTLRIVIPEDHVASDVDPFYEPSSLLGTLPIIEGEIQSRMDHFDGSIQSSALTQDYLNYFQSDYKPADSISWLNENIIWLKNIAGISLPFSKELIQKDGIGFKNLFYMSYSQTKRETNDELKNKFDDYLTKQKKFLEKHQFSVIRKVLAPEQLALLRKYCRDLYNNGYFQTEDAQEINRSFIHTEPMMKIIHSQLNQILNKVLPNPVKPSYSFLSRYDRGAQLTKHIDRKQCEWNVSLPIDITGDLSETPWPLHLEIDGVTESIQLNLGDIGIYEGFRYAHWRESYRTGSSTTICFFHFVDESFNGTLN